LNDNVADLLLASIQQDKLVFLCGAGLSMAAPTCGPSAVQLAEQCADEYDRRMLQIRLPAEARHDLGELAEFLLSLNRMDFFINKLVKWELFCGDPNSGHTAVADFVTCGGCFSVITTNFDRMIEEAAVRMGEKALLGALDGNEANNYARGYRPILKIHGCCSQPDYTLWCNGQLDAARRDPLSAKIQERLLSSRTWMQGILPNRDLVLVGFWSDWKYLNGVLLDSVKGIHPSKVLLVDPAADAELRAKAPDLWAWAAGFGPRFEHVREGAEVFLRELREIFSRSILSRVLKAAAEIAPGACRDFAVVKNALASLDSNALYALRRDFAGAPSGRVAKWKEPEDSMHSVGKVHLTMLSSGATLDGSSYVTDSGKRVRVINGCTLPMSKVREKYFAEPTKATPDDYVICAASESSAGYPNIVRPASPSIVRPGSTGEWLTEKEAIDRGIL
jgi:SIR2-like protein